MKAFYNEIDSYCCAWLQNLMDAGLITPGKIDDRSIVDVSPDDVRGYDRVHFFAGIAGWELALKLAGWGDRPVWSGSCPCQPFSSAGKGKASGDERHLWPHWFELIRACRPPVIFGEQVEAAIGWGWLDLVYSDLEEEGYAVGAAVLPACSVGAPHIRQRLWFVADSPISGRIEGEQITRGCEEGISAEGQSGRSAKHGDLGELGHSNGTASERRAGSILGAQAQERGQDGPEHGDSSERFTDASEAGELADHDSSRRLEPINSRKRGARGQQEQSERRGSSSELADAQCPQRGPHGSPHGRREHDPLSQGQEGPSGAGERGVMGNADEQGLQGWCLDVGEHAGQCATRPASPWDNLLWLPCTDGKQRPTQPGIFPLASGLRNRVAQLRAAGNSIVPQTAAEFIKASCVSVEATPKGN